MVVGRRVFPLGEAGSGVVVVTVNGAEEKKRLYWSVKGLDNVASRHPSISVGIARKASIH